MGVKITLIIIYLFLGCNGKTEQYGSKLKSDKLAIEQVEKEAYYHLKYINSNRYIIVWGTSKFKNISKDTFEVLGSGDLGLVDSNSQYIVLEQPCGSGCAVNVLLPLKPKQREKTFWNVLFNDLRKETIITTLDPGRGIFGIYKYDSKKEQQVKIPDLCPAADKSMCIDSLNICMSKVIFYYQGKNWTADAPDNRIKEVDLKEFIRTQY